MPFYQVTLQHGRFTLCEICCFISDYGNYVIRLETLPCYKNLSHCAANVYLKRTVAPRQKYTFRMIVTDTNGDTATKQVTLEVTDSTADINIVFPHIPGLIMVPEASINLSDFKI